MKKKIIAKSSAELQKIISKEIKKNGTNCDLNHIDISRIDSLAYLFSYTGFNGDISQWDTSNIEDMEGVFAHSQFDGDISNWNVSKVTKMDQMFECSEFNGDISKWDVSSLKYIDYMFKNSKFDGDISQWKPYNLDSGFHAFLCSSTPIPYWFFGGTKEEIKKTIDSYHLSRELGEELSESHSKFKKIKI